MECAMMSLSPFNRYVRKWYEKWKKEKVYEQDPIPSQKKFFVNFPYPYINGYLHLGHGYTLMKAEIIARLKRKEGYNVLFPQGFHATGQPIVAAAERVAEKEEKQIEILKKMGIKNIEEFADPVRWVEFFSASAKEHLELLGCAIDWRRSFITTHLNKAYDKFIRWQYKKLYEKGYIYKGSHPVVYCPKDNHAIGDHDRLEGEGVVPEKVVMIKFELKDKEFQEDVSSSKKRYLLAMTYRPETLWGVTNLWVNPKATYVLLKTTQGEEIIISKDVVEKFAYQDIKGEILEVIKGEDLVGKYAVNVILERKVPILPAYFVDPSVGSGIVMSVPAHAPYDYIALEDLKKNAQWREIVENIEVISLIELKGYGEFPAKEICQKMNISSQNEREKLEKATKEIYKLEFHHGVLKPIFGNFQGMVVKDAKEKIVRYLKSLNIAFDYYILPAKVVCRCLTEGVVKIVHDQWFIRYSDKKWKEKVHNHIEKMRFYPSSLKEVFHQAVEWLNDWAFTREKGLGSKFPYDESKVIESLSDSTVYMAYYTIAKYLENPEEYGINIDEIEDSFFDYVFLGKGDEKEIADRNKLSKELLRKIREEFLYWYEGGFELRVSGKDLIRNHLAMMLFHHVALFDERFWPKGVAVNGHIMVDGEKMSKSKGNFYTLREGYEIFGGEEMRFALAYAGNSGLDDSNFETSLVKEIREKLMWFENFALKHYGKGREGEKKGIDRWFLGRIRELIDMFLYHIDNLMTRDAIKYGFFDLNNALRWYLRRCLNNPHREVISTYIEAQLHVLSIVTPHYAQEVWEKIGKKGYVILLPFIEIEEINDYAQVKEFEEYVQNLIEDVHELQSLLARKGKKASKIKIICAEKWKYVVYELIKSKKNIKEIMESAKKESFFGVHPKIFSEFVSKSFAKVKKLHSYGYITWEDERKMLEESKEFLEKELGLEVIIEFEENSKETKAKDAKPYKPALVLS